MQSTLEGDPSGIVAGCVNVISGDFFDIQRDLVIEGPEPLVLERSYSSSDYSQGGLSNGWHFNLQGSVEYDNESTPPSRHKTYEVSYKGGYGRELRFRADKKDKTMLVHSSCFQHGISNTGSGSISAYTNLKNTKFNFTDKRHCTLRHIDGGEMLFEKHSGVFLN